MTWMPSADDATRVWNRAALYDSARRPMEAPGDWALTALLAAHSLIMNGGVPHCPEVLNTEEMAAAIAGFTYFGLNDAGAVLEEAASVSLDDVRLDEAERVELQLNERYWGLITSDQTIADAFKEKLFSTPGDFEQPT